MDGPRIAILGNCQTPLWADTLRAIAPDAEIVLVERIGKRGRTLSDSKESLDELEPDFAVILDQVADRIESDLGQLSERTQVVRVPNLVFNAFHPDITYLRNADGFIRSPLGSPWNSRLLMWSYQQGLSLQEALELFSDEVFQLVGYLNAWELATSSMRERFELNGFEFDPWISTVRRSGVFMNGINHPKPIAIAAIAYQIARDRLGVEAMSVEASQSYLVDRLVTSSVWPVQAPIANIFGVKPSHLVKVGDRFLRWTEFAQQCYAYWTQLGIESDGVKYMPNFDARTTKQLKAYVGITG